MGMSGSRYGRGEAGVGQFGYAQLVTNHFDVGMRTNGSYADEERPALPGSLIQEREGFRGNQVGRILAFVVDGRIFVVLEGGIQVLIRERIEEEVRAVEALRKGLVVGDGMGVEKLAGVILRAPVSSAEACPDTAGPYGVIPGLLKPQRKVVIVEASGQELGIPAIRRHDVRHIGVVGGLAGQEAHTRRTAQRHGAVVARIERALVQQMLLQQRLILDRRQVKILIVGDDEDNVRWAVLCFGRQDVLLALDER